MSTEVETIAESLKQFDFFKNLADETIHALVEKVEPLTMKGGEVLFNKGDEGDALYILEEGNVKMVSKDKGGAEIVLNHVGPGSIIGEMALIEESPRSAGVIALEDIKLLKLGQDEFMSVLMSQPLLGKEISRMIAERLRFTTTYIENAIEWSQQIAAGNYDFMEEQTKLEGESVGSSQSEQERASRFLGSFFSMVEDIKAREESLKAELSKLKVVIDQQKRDKEVSELSDTDFFKTLKADSETLRRKKGDTGKLEKKD